MIIPEDALFVICPLIGAAVGYFAPPLIDRIIKFLRERKDKNA